MVECVVDIDEAVGSIPTEPTVNKKTPLGKIHAGSETIASSIPIRPADFGLCPPEGGAESLNMSSAKRLGQCLKVNLFRRLRDAVFVSEPLKEEPLSLRRRRNYFCLFDFTRGLGFFRFLNLLFKPERAYDARNCNSNSVHQPPP